MLSVKWMFLKGLMVEMKNLETVCSLGGKINPYSHVNGFATVLAFH